MYHVAVEVDKCDGCEECVTICPQEVFAMSDGKSEPANTSECVFCESCLGVCPTTAITIAEM